MEAIIEECFTKKPSRSQGNKVAKAKVALLAKKESTLHAQTRAMDQMEQENLRKANNLQD